MSQMLIKIVLICVVQLPVKVILPYILYLKQCFSKQTWQLKGNEKGCTMSLFRLLSYFELFSLEITYSILFQYFF